MLEDLPREARTVPERGHTVMFGYYVDCHGNNHFKG